MSSAEANLYGGMPRSRPWSPHSTISRNRFLLYLLTRAGFGHLRTRTLNRSSTHGCCAPARLPPHAYVAEGDDLAGKAFSFDVEL